MKNFQEFRVLFGNHCADNMQKFLKGRRTKMTVVTKDWFESMGFSIEVDPLKPYIEFTASLQVAPRTSVVTIKYPKNRGFDTFLRDDKTGECRTLSDEENCETLTEARMAGLLRFFQINKK